MIGLCCVIYDLDSAFILLPYFPISLNPNILILPSLCGRAARTLFFLISCLSFIWSASKDNSLIQSKLSCLFTVSVVPRSESAWTEP